jgi:hypothetical protein
MSAQKKKQIKVKKKPINGCLFFMYVFIEFFLLDSFELVLKTCVNGRVYSALKDGKKFAIKAVSYVEEDEIERADTEEICYNMLKENNPYIANFIETFEDVFFFSFNFNVCFKRMTINIL